MLKRLKGEGLYSVIFVFEKTFGLAAKTLISLSVVEQFNR